MTYSCHAALESLVRMLVRMRIVEAVPNFALRTIEESIFSAFSGLAGDVKIFGLNKH